MTTPWRSPQIKVLTSEKNNPYATATATVNILPPDAKVKYVEGDIAVVEPNSEQRNASTFNMEPSVRSRGINTDNAGAVYELLLKAYINNPLRLNQYVVMSGDELCALIKELTGVKSVEIEAEVDISCCGRPSKFNTIKNIICINEFGTRLDFEIEYNKDYRLLEDYRISTKLTYDKEETTEE